MALFEAFVDFFKQKDTVTQADVLGLIRKTYPQYNSIPDDVLANAAAKKQPEQFGFLSTYEPKKLIEPAMVPQNLRDEKFYNLHPEMKTRDEAAKIINYVRETNPTAKEATDEQIAAQLEKAYPDNPNVKDLSKRIVAQKPAPGIAEKAVETIKNADPTKLVGKIKGVEDVIKFASAPFDPTQVKNETVLRGAGDFGAGLVGSAGAMAGAIPALEQSVGIKTGLGDKAQEVALRTREIAKELMPENPNFGDQVLSGAGSMALFMIPGLGAEAAVSQVPRMALLAGKLAPLVGTAVSSIMEAATEGGDTYTSEIEAGKKPEDAAKAAQKTFFANVLLVGITNKLGVFGEAGGALRRALVSAPFEAIQEAGQSVVQSLAQGQPINWNEVMQSAGVGAIVGGGAGVVTGSLSSEGIQNVDVASKTPQQAVVSKPDINQVNFPISEAAEKIASQPSQVANIVQAGMPEKITAKEVLNAKPAEYFAEGVAAKSSESGKISDMNKLEQEVKKYENADEFADLNVNYFHGTANDFDKFEFTDSARTTGFGNLKNVKANAFFFTKSKKIAEFFAQNRSEYLSKPGQPKFPIVKQVYLDINKTLDLTKINKQTIEKLQKIGIDPYNFFGFNSSDYVNNNFPENIAADPSDLFQLLDEGKIVEKIKSAGYDSVKLKEQNNLGESIAVFDPDLIKTKKELKEFFNKFKELNKPDLTIARTAPIQTAEEQLAVGAQTIDTFEKLDSVKLEQDKEEAQNFKLFDETRKIVHKYAARVGEKYLPRGARGVFYPGTDNIRVNSLNNISTAAHEVTHFLDKKYNIFERLQNTSKADLRNELAKVYLEYYPTAKIEHSDEIKTVEGTATFFQKMIEQPTEMKAKFPNLYTAFFKQHGSMYDPVFTEFVNDVRRAVKSYQDLDPLQKVGARITEKFQQQEIKDSYLNFRDKFVEQIVDSVYPIEKLAKEAGVSRTGNDPSLWVRQYNNINQIILNNFVGKRGFWTYTGGKFEKTSSHNIGNLIESLQDAGITDEFGHWLVARRQHFDYVRLDNLKEDYKLFKNSAMEMQKEIDSLIASIPEDKQSLKNKAVEEKRIAKFIAQLNALDKPLTKLAEFTLGKETEKLTEIQNQIQELRKTLAEDIFDYKKYRERVRLLNSMVESLQKLIQEQEGILKRDSFDRKVIDQAYTENADRFKSFSDIYDKLTKANLAMLANPDIGLITPKQYKEFSRREGYASFKRDVYDDIIGGESERLPSIQIGKTKISSTLGRKGSELTIINPLYSLAQDHAEIMRKSMKQLVYNKIYNITDSFPELFQRQQLKRVQDRETGAIIYPQEKDPNIIMARNSQGERTPVLVSREIKNIIDGLLTHNNIHILERLLRTANRMFVKGTTGIYPLFAPTNFIVDQITSSAQTRTKMIPVYDALANMSKVFLQANSQESKYYEEYLALGGERQTLLKWMDMTPEELFAAIKSEKKGLEKFTYILNEQVNKGLDILSIPNQATEIATRATEYVRSRMQGNPQIVALEDAGRVSVPFHHIGRLGGSTLGQTAIKSIPFMNPGIQALAQYYRAIQSSETRGRALFVTLAVTAALVSSAAWLMEKGTEEQLNLYKDLDPRELAMYLWYPAPDGKKLLKIRVPEQMAALATMINMEMANLKINAGYKIGDIINGGAAFLPDQFDISDPMRMFYSFLPQLIKPLNGVFTNTREFPKVRPLVSKGLQFQEPRFQFHENTSEFSKWLGDKLNLSPIKIDYLIEGYLGRTSRFVTGKPISNPFMREWYFTAGRNLQDYYEFREDVRARIKSIKDGNRVATDTEIQELQVKGVTSKEVERMLDTLNKIKKTGSEEKYQEEIKQLRRMILDRIEGLRD